MFFPSSVDPVNTIREQCQMLLQMGRTNDVARISHELNIFTHSQVSAMNLKFADEGKRT